jgi:hypothetical protein
MGGVSLNVFGELPRDPSHQKLEPKGPDVQISKLVSKVKKNSYITGTVGRRPKVADWQFKQIKQPSFVRNPGNPGNSVLSKTRIRSRLTPVVA